jgi:hypothetical protein
MSLTARLHIYGHPKQDKGIRVLECSFEFKQEADLMGQPKGIVQGGIVEFLLDVENDSELIHWMLNNVYKNGKIVYIGPSEGKPIKTIEFEEAAMIKYHEEYKEVTAVKVRITISCHKITIAGEEMDNSWAGFR